MSKHTPGPWEVGGFSGTDVCVPPRRAIGPDGEPTWVVSIVASVHNPATDDFSTWTQDKSGELDDPVVKANARLIAAAPDLLSALEELLADLGAEAKYFNGTDAARAAIAKAKGETK